MGEHNRALGIGPSVEINGERWQLSEFGPGIRAEFEAWMEDNARRALLPLRDDLQAYAACMKEVAADINAQRYKWYGPGWPTPEDPSEFLRVLKTFDGQTYLLYLFLKENHSRPSLKSGVPRITVEKAHDLWETSSGIFAPLIEEQISKDRKNRGLPPLEKQMEANGTGTAKAESEPLSTTSAPSLSESPSISVTTASGGLVTIK